MIIQMIQLGIGASISYLGYRWFLTKRLVEDLPTSKIRGLAMGLAEVKGKARFYKDNILISPISQRKCIYYAIMILGLVERMDDDMNKKIEWAPIKTASSAVPYFVLEDSTGSVLVETKGHKGLRTIRAIKTEEFKPGLGPHEAEVKKLLSPRLDKRILDNPKKMTKHYELLVCPGDELYAIGTAGDNPFVEEATAQKSVDDIMMHQGSDGILYITEKKEEGYLRGLKIKYTASFIIGGFFIFAALFSLLLNALF
ncbi:MAG: hypothetical protein KKE20_04625 [Nanoarchaeota archaeon]|nr:hypothetical protein [Nanoarchaeota archaeon]